MEEERRERERTQRLRARGNASAENTLNLVASSSAQRRSVATSKSTTDRNLRSGPATAATILSNDQRDVLAPFRYVLLPRAETLTGYTMGAMHAKIKRGDWVENREYVRAPDGRIVIDLVGIEKWLLRR